MIDENIKYLTSLKEASFSCKSANKIDNWIKDGVCKAIFVNSFYIANLEKLWLNGKKE